MVKRAGTGVVACAGAAVELGVAAAVEVWLLIVLGDVTAVEVCAVVTRTVVVVGSGAVVGCVSVAVDVDAGGGVAALWHACDPVSRTEPLVVRKLQS
jgi:hypothetical protein